MQFSIQLPDSEVGHPARTWPDEMSLPEDFLQQHIRPHLRFVRRGGSTDTRGVVGQDDKDLDAYRRVQGTERQMLITMLNMATEQAAGSGILDADSPFTALRRFFRWLDENWYKQGQGREVAYKRALHVLLAFRYLRHAYEEWLSTLPVQSTGYLLLPYHFYRLPENRVQLAELEYGRYLPMREHITDAPVWTDIRFIVSEVAGIGNECWATHLPTKQEMPKSWLLRRNGYLMKSFLQSLEWSNIRNRFRAINVDPRGCLLFVRRSVELLGHIQGMGHFQTLQEGMQTFLDAFAEFYGNHAVGPEFPWRGIQFTVGADLSLEWDFT